MACLAVRLCGRRYEASEEQHPGFFQRVEGSFLRAIADGPSAVMATRGSDGCVELQEAHMPEEVQRLFPEIWGFLQTGRWKEARSSLQGFQELRTALAFLNIKVRQLPMDNGLAPVIVHRHMLMLPKESQDPISLVWLESAPTTTQEVQGGFDVQLEGGATTLWGRGFSVKVDPTTGALYLKVPESTAFVLVAINRSLRGKLMHAMLLRHSCWPLLRQGEGYLLFVQFRPRNCRDQQNFASWPSFWYLAELELVGSRGELQCRRQVIRPGGLAVMEDAVCFVTNVESLRCARLTIFRAQASGALCLPGVVVNLVAPKAYEFPSQYYGRSAYSRGAKDVRTLHPEGRAPAALWLVRRGHQLVLVIHAADKRVALAQLSGPNGTKPPLGDPVHAQTGQGQFWDVWCRHDRSTQTFRGMHRYHLRGKRDVPMCEQVLSVIPCEVGVLILHRETAKSLPRCWCVRLDTPILAQWSHSRWQPSEKWPDHLPEPVPVCTDSPMEFQRWQLLNGDLELRQSFGRVRPIGPGGRPDVAKGSGKGKPKNFWPWAPTGAPRIQQWRTQLE
ncbi:unnamed protein product [Effrenium voratum]|uniref:Uncharacterized protein n=1 Tax=Effrenium voratum TaxID=2562239 RepID=A0AA36JRC6_9DINO|nr:unnamed protein product [Effrenium voratum]CAJ1422756.1 unnamed protein product [Effrenium voratum]